jgi:hypothetical protein
MIEIKQSDVMKEIRETYRRAQAERKPLPQNWLIAEIQNAHELPPSVPEEVRAFYLLVSYEALRQWTGAFFRNLQSLELSDEDDASNPIQGALGDFREKMAGYTRLQIRYVVTRDGAQVSVPTELLLGSEIRAKAAEQRTAAAGRLEHASELEKYLAERGYEDPAELIA